MKTLLIACMTVFAALGCTSDDEAKNAEEVVGVEQQEEGGGETNGIEAIDQAIEAAGEVTAGQCDKEVIGKSEHAVADPCMTTQEFMQQLGMNQGQIDQVMAMVDRVGNPKRAVAE